MGNHALNMIRFLLQLVLGKGDLEKCSLRDQDLLNHFSKDIRTVKRVFGQDAKLETWAACPKCHFTYPPGEYPIHCTNKKFLTSPRCGAEVTTRKTAKGESVLTLKPYRNRIAETLTMAAARRARLARRGFILRNRAKVSFLRELGSTLVLY
jgi:hypothetical protein